MADDLKTPNRRYPLPDRTHAGVTDADRLKETVSLIDNDMATALQLATASALGRVLLATAAKMAAGDAGSVPTAMIVKDYVAAEIDNLIGSAPGVISTLADLAEALGNDPNFASTVSSQIATKADKAETERALNDRYTRGEADSLLADKADRVATENALAARATATALAALADVVATKHTAGASRLDFSTYSIRDYNNGNLDFWAGDTLAGHICQDGNIYTPMFGYIRDYIEARKNEAYQAAINWAWTNPVQDVRLTGGFRNDYQNTGRIGGGGGEVITTIDITHQTNLGGTLFFSLQTRYLQVRRCETWYTIGTW